MLPKGAGTPEGNILFPRSQLTHFLLPEGGLRRADFDVLFVLSVFFPGLILNFRGIV